MDGIDPLRVIVMVPGSRPLFSMQALQSWIEASLYLANSNRYIIRIIPTETSINDLRPLKEFNDYDVVLICQYDIIFRPVHLVMLLESMLHYPVVCGYYKQLNQTDCHYKGAHFNLDELEYYSAYNYITHSHWGFAALKKSIVDMISTAGDLSTLLAHAEIPMVVHTGIRVSRETLVSL